MTSTSVPLGTMILNHLRATSASNGWSHKTQDALRTYLTSGHTDRLALARALRRWVEKLPQEDAHKLDTVLPESPWLFLNALLVPLTIHGREAQWLKEDERLDMVRIEGSAWSSDRPTRHEMEALLVTTRILRDTIEEARDYDDAWQMVRQWVMTHNTVWPHVSRDSIARDLPLLAEMWTNIAIASENADKQRPSTDVSTPLVSRWRVKFNDLLKGVLVQSQEEFVWDALLRSKMSDTLKSITLKLAPSSVWLRDDAKTYLDASLPSDPCERSKALPWNGWSSEENRALAFLYIPEQASLLDSLGSSSVWGHQGEYTTLLKELTKDTEKGAELTPGDGFDSPSH